MSRNKLPPEAFEFYLNLGIERTYVAVARHFRVSKRTVSQRAAKECWSERLAQYRTALLGDIDERARAAISDADVRLMSRVGKYQDALHEVVTPKVFKAITASTVKAAIHKGDTAAARFIMERILGRPRIEPLPESALDLPDGLSTTQQVKEAANSVLQGVAAGEITPEDAQRLASVVETARKAIETDDLEKRLTAIEDEMKKDKQR